MSWMPGADPDVNFDFPETVEMVIIPRTGDLGNFGVLRSLPFRRKRMVGPFIFWDQMGPGEFLSGQGIDVRPHPHIGLSTVTYLFDGSLHHRDSLGTDQTILPGEINLMSAGSGIVHSERTGQKQRQVPSRLFGIQSWLAQPLSREESSPTFHHQSRDGLPEERGEGVQLKVLLGEAFGLRSSVPLDWPAIYLDINLEKGARFSVPREVEERALYGLSGRFEVAGQEYPAKQMVVLRPGAQVTIKALEPTRLTLLGGEAMDGPRYIWWNFVSSSRERLEQAKEDWRLGRFAPVPGDSEEFIPLP
ncbi:MAG: pirin family protein [Vulcanimicrobiota bacterium]